MTDNQDNDFSPQKIVQTRGPTYRFDGRLLVADEFDAQRGDVTAGMEVWETRGGALVAVSKFTPKAGGFTDVSAIAANPDQDELAQRLQIMDFFEWSNRARAMVRKLKWKLTVHIA